MLRPKPERPHDSGVVSWLRPTVNLVVTLVPLVGYNRSA